MDVLTCLDRLAARPALECGNFPPSPQFGAALNNWRYSAVAAIELSGMMPDCQSDDDLGEALDHFWSLLYGGVVSREEWVETMMEVVQRARQRVIGSPRLPQTSAR